MLDNIRFLLRLLVHEAAWRGRMGLARLRSGRMSRILTELREHGFAIVPAYFSHQEMAVLESICDNAMVEVRNGAARPTAIRLSGAIRILDIHLWSELAMRFARDPFLMAINAVFCGRLNGPSLMFALTHDGKHDDATVPGAAEHVFGDHYHFDQWFHQLKAFTALDNVGPENGPLTVVPNTSGIQWGDIDTYRRKFSAYHKLPRSGDRYDTPENADLLNPVKRSIFESQVRENGAVEITVSRGDLVLFDTRTFHFAGSLRTGRRRLLWYYF